LRTAGTPFVADQFKHFVIGHPTAGEADGPAVDFEQVGAELAAEFFGLGVPAEDQSFFAVGFTAGQLGGQLIGQRSVQPGGHVQAGDADLVVAVERLNPLHGRPDQFGEQVVRGDAAGDGGVDELPAGRAVAVEQRLQVRLGKAGVDRRGRSGGDSRHGRLLRWQYRADDPSVRHNPLNLRSNPWSAGRYKKVASVPQEICRKLIWVTFDTVSIGGGAFFLYPF
jgi:hypothetical protein